jgi:hypothetical protein
VAAPVDFQQEADGCFRLAQAETHAEVRAILMGMGYGWLTLASHHKASRDAHHGEPFEEPTDEPYDLPEQRPARAATCPSGDASSGGDGR